MWITEVELDGEPLALDGVLSDVTIRHGRAGVYDQPQASTLQLTLLDVTGGFTSAFRVGVPITVWTELAPRFTGTVTDATLDEDVLTVIGVGPLATLSRYGIGSGAWPAEPWHDRVLRVFAEAGVSELLTLHADAAFNPTLTARDPEPVTLADYLGALADDVGAAIVDTPDGHVLIQQLTARAQVSGLTWETTDPALAWNEADPACSWEEATDAEAIGLPGFLPHLVVDPADVLYVPTWAQALDLENETTVGYGDNLEVTATEPSSVDHYGPYPGGVSTQIAGLADATLRAEQRVARRAYPRWVIPSAPLIVGYPLEIGQVVELSGFPPASPHAAWAPVLEGWVDTVQGDEWTSELALSDPVFSNVGLNWEDAPAALAWNECEPACRWIDAVSLDALAPGFPALTLIAGGSSHAEHN